MRIVLSGYTQINTVLTAINRGEIFRFITKPWKLEEEFKSVIKQAIEHYDLVSERDTLVDRLKVQNEELEKRIERAVEIMLIMKSQAEVGKQAAEMVNNIKPSIQRILGFLEHIHSSIPKNNVSFSKLIRYIQNALDSVNALRRMAGEILKRSTSERNGEYKEFSINELIRQEISFLEISPEFRNRITKNLSLDDRLPKITGDPNHFRQILDNLLTNAIDAMESSKVRQISIRSYLKGQCVAIDITDTGAGIDSEHLPRVFDPDFTTKPPGKGTGLGLATVKRMVQSYSGTIEVNSIKGQGTRVSLVFGAGKNNENDETGDSSDSEAEHEKKTYSTGG